MRTFLRISESNVGGWSGGVIHEYMLSANNYGKPHTFIYHMIACSSDLDGL